MHVISNIGKMFCGGEHISIRDGGPLVVLFYLVPRYVQSFLKHIPYIFSYRLALMGCSSLFLGCSGLFWVVFGLFGLFRVVPSFSNDATKKWWKLLKLKIKSTVRNG